jgi:ATP-dependent DNA helicase RecG
MSANEIDRILALPIDERAVALTAVPEDQWFERKSIRVAPKDFALPLVALANAEGGTVIIGVHRGEVEGVRRHVKHVP